MKATSPFRSRLRRAAHRRLGGRGRRIAQSGEFPTAATSRDFTGHEQLDAHGVIHMNGHVYDPALGRFLSIDPLLHSYKAGGGQPEPLSAVVPSGYAREYASHYQTEQSNRGVLPHS